MEKKKARPRKRKIPKPSSCILQRVSPAEEFAQLWLETDDRLGWVWNDDGTRLIEIGPRRHTDNKPKPKPYAAKPRPPENFEVAHGIPLPPSYITDEVDKRSCIVRWVDQHIKCRNHEFEVVSDALGLSEVCVDIMCLKCGYKTKQSMHRLRLPWSIATNGDLFYRDYYSFYGPIRDFEFTVSG